MMIPFFWVPLSIVFIMIPLAIAMAWFPVDMVTIAAVAAGMKASRPRHK